MSYKKLAVQNYERFCGLEGSEYIASEFALETILKIIKKFEIKNVLELGLGIGSISDTVLKYSKLNNEKITYVGTEKNEFCLNALKKNVENIQDVELHSELHDLKKGKFDLIIIDGYDDTLKEIVSFCKQNTIIFIEGDRKVQTELMLDIFPKNKYVNVITLKKNRPYAHGACETTHCMGGGQLIFINPTLYMKWCWGIEKIKTFTKMKLRK